MIFLIVFGIIALVVITLNMIDSSNLEKIENHFKLNNCQNIVYSKGIYKGICKDEIMQISNSFSVDLEENKTTFKIDKIKNIEEKDMSIIINSIYSINFKEKENMNKFYKDLKEKID